MKKKMLAVCLALSLCVCLLSGVSFAAGDVTVHVTIADAGELVLVNQPVKVTDINEDGALTISDVLTAAHDLYYEAAEDAADNGFVFTDEGFITKLWGVENGGSYGYYLNHSAAMSLSDPVEEGDYLAAYTYADLDAWTDMYTYFENAEAACAPEAEFVLKLTGAGYDENWNPVSVPVVGAKILVDGVETAYVTDENGEASVLFAETGVYTVSAVSETETIVPPVCVVTVAEGNEEETDGKEDGTQVEIPAFTDVAGHWGEEAILYTVEQGYLVGVSDTAFAPDNGVSRAMIVTVLYRMAGEPDVTAENSFVDLTQDTWYTDAVLWAAQEGFVLGDNGRFRPDDTLTRQETALILYRWAQDQGFETSDAADLSVYEDSGAVADWAQEAVAWACGAGVVTGTSETALSPAQSLSRAELALMLMRLDGDRVL